MILDVRDTTTTGGYSPEDYLIGTMRADAFVADAGDAYGWYGDNTITGGIVDQDIYGGPGDDTIAIVNVSGAESVFGGPGNDTLVLSDVYGGTDANLVSGTVVSGGTTQFTQEFENITGSDANEVPIGSIENNLLRSVDGTDTLCGEQGNDTLIGEAGSDVLSGGGGADPFVFAANKGNDRITDFTSLDKIDIAAFGVDNNGASGQDWRDAALSIVPSGGGSDATILWDGGGSQVLENTTIASLTDAFFIF